MKRIDCEAEKRINRAHAAQAAIDALDEAIDLFKADGKHYAASEMAKMVTSLKNWIKAV